MSIDKDYNSCDMQDSLNTLSLRKTRQIQNNYQNQILQDASRDSLLNENPTSDQGEVEYFQQLQIEEQMKDIKSSSTLNIHSLQQVLGRLATVLGKQDMWLTRRMADIENLCKEFIDAEGKDDHFHLDPINSQRPDFATPDGYKHTFEFEDNPIDRIDQKKTSLSNLHGDEKVKIQGKDNFNQSKIDHMQQMKVEKPKSLGNFMKANQTEENQIKPEPEIDIIQNNIPEGSNENKINQEVKSNKSTDKVHKFDENSEGVKKLYEDEENDKKVINDIQQDKESVVEENTTPMHKPKFRKAVKTPENQGGAGNTPLEKTISKVRESLLSDIESYCHELIDTAINKNFASLNIEQMLKVPENKIDPIRNKLAELFSKFQQQGDTNNSVNQSIDGIQANIKILVSRIETIEETLSRKANDTEITAIYDNIAKLITQEEMELLKADMENLVRRDEFNISNHDLHSLREMVEKEYSSRELTYKIRDDINYKIQDLSVGKADVGQVGMMKDSLTNSLVSNTTHLKIIDNNQEMKFEKVNKDFQELTATLKAKENLADADLLRKKIETLESKERVEELANEILPRVKGNAQRLLDNDENIKILKWELQRLNEMVASKPDRQDLEAIAKKIDNSVSRENQNLIFSKQEDLCNNLDNRVSKIDSSNRFTREDLFSQMEGLRSELYSINIEHKESPKVEFRPRLNSSSPKNQNVQTQFNKNVIIIILSILKTVYFGDEHIASLKGSLFSSAQSLQQKSNSALDDGLRDELGRTLEQMTPQLFENERHEKFEILTKSMYADRKIGSGLNERQRDSSMNLGTNGRPKSTAEIKRRNVRVIKSSKSSANSTSYDQENKNQKSISVFPFLKIN